MNFNNALEESSWVQGVTTSSTSPPKGIFSKSAEEIAKVMTNKSVSPKGPGSAIKMIQYFINRAGKKLSTKRKRELEKAKNIIQTKS